MSNLGNKPGLLSGGTQDRQQHRLSAAPPQATAIAEPVKIAAKPTKRAKKASKVKK